MKVRSLLAAAAVVLALLGTQAEAQATRTWVSGVGDDVNPCSRTAPCKTFAGAISKTAAGGEISVLDPGGFGAVTITKSITIDGTGTLASILASGTNGIVINSASAVVTLRNLQINGAGTTLGLNGIRVLAATSVSVENCHIYGFSQEGIEFLPTANASLFVKDTVISNNNGVSGGGIFSQGTATATASVFLDNVRLERNFFGIKAQDFSKVNIRNSAAVGNVNNGFWAFSVAQPVEMTIETSRSSGNGVGGVRAEGSSTVVRLSNTTVTNNLVGFQTGTGGEIESFGNNHQTANGTNNAPNVTILAQ
jgi:hypothetical protein